MIEVLSDYVIVGGGLTGILLALKISLGVKNKSITIIEENPTLGGRLFFSSPRSFLAKERPQIYEEILKDSQANQHLSGFGFELFDLQTKESIFRHIQNTLTEEEKNQLEEYLNRFEIENQEKLQNICYFIKKDWVTSPQLLQGSSEILTKKEAETLKYLSFDVVNAEIHEWMKTPFEKSEFWKDLPKGTKESLAPLFESLISINWESIPFIQCCQILNRFFSAEKFTFFIPFQRKVAIEMFLEKVLINRGVKVRNLCRLIRVEDKRKEGFTLTLNDEVEPSNKVLSTKQLILTIPLASCAGVLPKEIYSPEQSKFASRIQPLSLVVYEVLNFPQVKIQASSFQLNIYDKLIFPVERVKAFYTSDERLLFYVELEYENSLQASSVREAVSRLKRAATRVLNEDAVKEMKKGVRMPQSQFMERIILLPVAHTVPIFAKINFELKQLKMGIPNLYCCGDSLFSLADEPWKRVIHSASDLAHHLS